jgi:hypothetical protein
VIFAKMTELNLPGVPCLTERESLYRFRVSSSVYLHGRGDRFVVLFRLGSSQCIPRACRSSLRVPA